MNLLLDEMYPAALAMALREKGINALTAVELRPAGRPDIDVFTVAADGGYAILTENVSDFARISGEHVVGGGHHCGVLIALSSRFSRRPAGYGAIVARSRPSTLIALTIVCCTSSRPIGRRLTTKRSRRPWTANPAEARERG